MKTHRLLALLLVGLTACAGEGSGGSGAAAAAAPREVHFTASDFAFEGPSTIEAGLVALTLTNNGPDMHHMVLVRLEDGMTLEAFQEGLTQMQPGSPPPPWLHEVGGVNPPPNGGSAKVDLMVEPGEYAVICMVDTPDHVPHALKGMVRPLTVTPATSASAALPPGDLTLTLVDWAFSFSTPPTAGSHVIHVMNDAQQDHEVAFIKLNPGMTVDDVMAWAETYANPTPFVMHGGVAPMAPGQMINAYVDFTPGDWMALCFVADATDGAPHVVHGMMLPFTIS